MAHGWLDVAALGTLIVMALSGVAWGLKLENRSSEMERIVYETKALVDRGILPLAEEKLARIASDHAKMQADFDAYRIEVQTMKLEIARSRLGIPTQPPFRR